MKTYFTAIRDHSGSMSSIARAAARDYNAMVAATQHASVTHNIDTSFSVIRCGGSIYRELHNSPIAKATTLLEREYTCGGGTPLFASVNTAIDDIMRVPDFNDPEVTFIVMATTDGADTGGRNEGALLAGRISELQNTDRWTFVFRVPRGYAKTLTHLGIPEGNILEWDQTERGVQAASDVSATAFNSFYSARATGTKSTRTFYSSMKDVTVADVKSVLTDISKSVLLWPVPDAEAGSAIRDFVESRLSGAPMLKGAAFYQLVKTEDKIQATKKIVIRVKDTGAVYYGQAARDLIGLPHHTDARVRPENHGQFDVFIQSTSVNRKVSQNTQILYWADVGKAFKEGVSAR